MVDRLTVVRAALPSDLDALLEIETQAFASDRLDRRALRHAIRSKTILALVAGDGPVEGYALVQLRRGSGLARLTSLAVRAGSAGRGIGRALLGACEAAAGRHGCDRMRLEVRADNRPAARLYEAASYLTIGTEPDYYEDGEAAIRFEKALTPG